MIRRTRVKKSRGVRRGPWRSEKFRRWIASHGCCVCMRPSQAAHTELGGMSQKGSDASCVPLCPRHHDELDGRIPGAHGLGAFDLQYGVNLPGIAAAMFDLWKRTTGKAAA